jgi:hypothetical protein
MSTISTSSWSKGLASNISGSSSSTKVSFSNGWSYKDSQTFSKICVKISDVSKYKDFTVKTTSITGGGGIWGCYFGLYSNYNSSNYRTSKTPSGLIVQTDLATSSSKKNYKITVPSGTTGVAYLGFCFYDNSTNSSMCDNGCTINFSSITATDNVYSVSYNANGGSGTTSSHTNITPGNSITLRANGFTAPTSAVWTLSGLNANGGASIKATFSSNSFYRWRTGKTSGTYRDPGYVFTPTANTTFYAQWKTAYTITATRNSYREAGLLVTYNANGGICPLKNDRS